MKNKKRNWIIAIIAAALLGGCGWLLWYYYPMIQGLMEPRNMAAFQAQLRSFGVFGVLVLLGIQVLQVFSGIVPALPIQLGAGVTYGALGGLAVCLGGIALGSSIVFLAVRRFGRPLVDRVFPEEKQKKLAFLQDADRLGLITFIIYLIPAMPKDVLNYLAALTPLTLRRYLAITLIARAPTILGNTFAASALLEGNTTMSVVTFCITGTLGLGCMLLSKRILGWMRSFKKRERP